jgi:hypothetical protein
MGKQTKQNKNITQYVLDTNIHKTTNKKTQKKPTKNTQKRKKNTTKNTTTHHRLEPH